MEIRRFRKEEQDKNVLDNILDEIDPARLQQKNIIYEFYKNSIRI